MRQGSLAAAIAEDQEEEDSEEKTSSTTTATRVQPADDDVLAKKAPGKKSAILTLTHERKMMTYIAFSCIDVNLHVPKAATAAKNEEEVNDNGLKGLLAKFSVKGGLPVSELAPALRLLGLWCRNRPLEEEESKKAVFFILKKAADTLKRADRVTQNAAIDCAEAFYDLLLTLTSKMPESVSELQSLRQLSFEEYKWGAVREAREELKLMLTPLESGAEEEEGRKKYLRALARSEYILEDLVGYLLTVNLYDGGGGNKVGKKKADEEVEANKSKKDEEQEKGKEDSDDIQVVKDEKPENETKSAEKEKEKNDKNEEQNGVNGGAGENENLSFFEMTKKRWFGGEQEEGGGKKKKKKRKSSLRRRMSFRSKSKDAPSKEDKKAAERKEEKKEKATDDKKVSFDKAKKEEAAAAAAKDSKPKRSAPESKRERRRKRSRAAFRRTKSKMMGLGGMSKKVRRL